MNNKDFIRKTFPIASNLESLFLMNTFVKVDI